MLRSITTAAVAALVAIPTLSGAQEPGPRPSSLEVRVPSGALIGTGSQRHEVKDGQMTAVQLSWLVRPRVAITGTFAWARSRDLTSLASDKLDVFSSDLGVEARTHEWFADAPVSVSGFAGVGAGARSYNYRKLDVAATHNVAGYAAVGGQVRARRVGLRLEARDYATGFKPLAGVGRSSSRNDVVVLAAVTLHSRRDR